MVHNAKVNKLRYYYALMKTLEANDPDHPFKRSCQVAADVYAHTGLRWWWYVESCCGGAVLAVSFVPLWWCVLVRFGFCVGFFTKARKAEKEERHRNRSQATIAQTFLTNDFVHLHMLLDGILTLMDAAYVIEHVIEHLA